MLPGVALIFANERRTGNVAERQHSQSRRAILDALAQHGEMSPKEMVEEAEIPYGAMKALLHRLAQDKVIAKTGCGRFALPSDEK